MNKYQVRNGDLLIEKIYKLPKGLKKVRDGIILKGIATGHAHRVVGGDVKKDGKTFFIEVKKEATLKHEEHNDIVIPKGFYQVIRQQEYDLYEGVRNVED